ncbi:MAG: hypothetical protein FWB95_08075 [Treponema sp.]|nr:hypothetical protein [Treponema sp.]
MATIKKAAAKPAAKKPAAKKPAAKKPAAKAASAKKPAAKKPAAKAASAKKPTAKTASAKKPAAKKPAAKASPAKKPAAKPVSKPATKKPAAEKFDVPFRNLFDAFAQGKLPFNQGYIVSSFFSEKSMYSIYEIVSYAGVKEIFPTADGLTFVTGGKKLYVLLEPDTFHQKFVEPVSRSEGEKIPKRFTELETITASNQTRIMVSKEPNESYGSFTILKPTGINFSMIFYDTPELFGSLTAFFTDSFNRLRRVPAGDAKKAGKLIADIVKKGMSFAGEFQ